MAFPLLIIPGVTRITRQLDAAAAEYFSQSDSYPAPRVCRPLTHTPPSISHAIRCLGHARSNRHLRGGANACSRFNPAHCCEHIAIKTECGFIGYCAQADAVGGGSLLMSVKRTYPSACQFSVPILSTITNCLIVFKVFLVRWAVRTFRMIRLTNTAENSTA